MPAALLACGVLLGATVVAPGVATADTAGCSIATATLVTPGVATGYNVAACGGTQWLTVSATAGSTVVLDMSTASVYVYFYQPGTTDFSYGGLTAVFECNGRGNGFSEFTCRVSRTGIWNVRVTRGIASSTGIGTVTSTIHAAAHQAGQVTGSCVVSSAPRAPYRVTQYAFGGTCSGSHGAELWKLPLYRGDKVVMRIATFVKDPTTIWWDHGAFDLRGPGVTDFTYDGAPKLCGDQFIPNGTSEQVACTIVASGIYVMGGQEAISLLPLVTHSVTNTLIHASTVGLRKTTIVTDRLTSPAGVPVGVCQLQLKGTTWKAVRTVTTIAGRCTIPVAFNSRGYKTLRIRQVGAAGWASHFTAAWRIRVV